VASHLEKIVTVRRSGHLVDIRVRFFEDVVVEERNDRLQVDGEIEMITDESGLTLLYDAPDRARRKRQKRRY